MKKTRVIGTSIEQIRLAESELKRKLPQSFVNWLLENNGKDIGNLTIFPVYDPRDPRKTWNSIVKNFNGNWQEWLSNFSDTHIKFSNLIPFSEFGTGDYYCFDYLAPETEPKVVLWLHETGETKKVAENFNVFLENLNQ